MDERPPQPPEGKLLADALATSGLSIREASRRAQISYGRWRQITTGYQNVSPGSYAAVRAPAKTLARMARVVGVTAEQMERDGERPDAAEEMLSGEQPHLRAVPAAPSAVPDNDDDEPDEFLAYVIETDPVAAQLWALREPDGGLRPPRERRALIRTYLHERATYGKKPNSGSGTGGLPPVRSCVTCNNTATVR